MLPTGYLQIRKVSAFGIFFYLEWYTHVVDMCRQVCLLNQTERNIACGLTCFSSGNSSGLPILHPPPTTTHTCCDLST